MKPGRPREIDDPVRMNVSIEAQDYDRIDALARRQGSSAPAVVRQAISVLLNRQQSQTSAQ